MREEQEGLGKDTYPTVILPANLPPSARICALHHRELVTKVYYLLRRVEDTKPR